MSEPEQTPKDPKNTGEQLFRKEAMERRARSLFGDVILRAHPARWWVTALVMVTATVLITLLLGLQVEGQSLFRWVTR